MSIHCVYILFMKSKPLIPDYLFFCCCYGSIGQQENVEQKRKKLLDQSIDRNVYHSNLRQTGTMCIDTLGGKLDGPTCFLCDIQILVQHTVGNSNRLLYYQLMNLRLSIYIGRKSLFQPLMATESNLS